MSVQDDFESRQRSRKERRGLGYPEPPAEDLELAAIGADPAAYMEQRRGAWILEVERAAAQERDPSKRAAIYLHALKMTSLGRVKIDVSATMRRFEALPDLSHASLDDLRAVLRGELAAPPREAIDVTPTVVKPAPDAGESD